MMRREEQNKDLVVGKLLRGKKKNGDKAKYFSLMFFEVDEKGELVTDGTIKINGKEYPKHKIVKSFRVAESSLLKVAADDQKSCNIYERRR